METVTPAGLPPRDAPAPDMTGPDITPAGLPPQRLPVVLPHVPTTVLVVAALAGIGLFTLVNRASGLFGHRDLIRSLD